MYDQNGAMHILPWTYNETIELQYENNLPPSLQRFKPEDFIQIQLTDWG